MVETESGPVGAESEWPSVASWGRRSFPPEDPQPSWEASPPPRKDSLVAVVNCGCRHADAPCPLWKAESWAPGAHQDGVPGQGSREPLTL